MDFLKVIKFEGDDKTLVYKYPKEDFNTMSQLIVHQSQEAILFKDGKALDLFGPGKYELKTQNIPLLKNIINIPTEGISPFHCEVYFINKVMELNIEWGTNSRFEVLDPTFGVPLSVGASGTMEFKIQDSRKFLIDVVGTQNVLSANQLIKYVKGKIVTKVKSYLATIMGEISYLNINQHLDEVSDALKIKLYDYFLDYGVNLINFYISTIIIPNEDTDKIKSILNKKLEYGTLNYSWADEQIAEISKKYAENLGTQEGIGGMIAQVPLALAFGEMLKGNITESVANPFLDQSIAFNNDPSSNYQNSDKQINNSSLNLENSQNKFCSNCGTKLREGALFCTKCGKKVEVDLKCSGCGAKILEDDIFCSKCGYKLK